MYSLKIQRIFILIILFLIVSCVPIPDTSIKSHDVSKARMLLYMHSTESMPPDVEFAFSGIALKNKEGNWVELLSEPVSASALALVDNQIFLGEAFIDGGVYVELRVEIFSAFQKIRGERLDLKVEEPAKEIRMPLEIDIKKGDSFVLGFAWDPVKSVTSGDRFKLSIEPLPQSLSLKDILLFVSNSGSNYLTVIDRSYGRVVGALTVGNSPMGMAIDEFGDYLYIVNSGDSTLSVLNLNTFQIEDTIDLFAGIDPIEIALMPEGGMSFGGKLYVANRGSDDVTVVDLLTKRVVKSVPVGDKPSHIAVDSERREVYVTNEESDSLSIIISMNDSVAAQVAVDESPKGIFVGEEGIYVFNRMSGTISVVSPASRSVEWTVSVAERPYRGLRLSDGRLFVVPFKGNTLSVFDSADVYIRDIEIGDGPVGLDMDISRNRLYVSNSKDNTVSVVDTVSERLLKGIRVVETPYGVVILERQ